MLTWSCRACLSDCVCSCATALLPVPAFLCPCAWNTWKLETGSWMLGLFVCDRTGHSVRQRKPAEGATRDNDNYLHLPHLPAQYFCSLDFVPSTLRISSAHRRGTQRPISPDSKINWCHHHEHISEIKESIKQPLLRNITRKSIKQMKREIS